jgi:DNA-binding transcriptional ArsR family regulator
MSELDDILRALADPTRRRIFELLGERPGLTTSQLADRIPSMTRWGVMKHLAALRDADLLQTLPEGRRRRHFREPAALNLISAWLRRAGSASE